MGVIDESVGWPLAEAARRWQVRAQVAGLLGCTQQEVFLFSCTTQALTAVAKGLLASGFLRAGKPLPPLSCPHGALLLAWRIGANFHRRVLTN